MYISKDIAIPKLAKSSDYIQNYRTYSETCGFS